MSGLRPGAHWSPLGCENQELSGWEIAHVREAREGVWKVGFHPDVSWTRGREGSPHCSLPALSQTDPPWATWVGAQAGPHGEKSDSNEVSQRTPKAAEADTSAYTACWGRRGAPGPTPVRAETVKGPRP